MPCYQERRTTVTLEAADLHLLKEALEAEGHRYVRIEDESISFQTAEGSNGSYRSGRLNVPQGFDSDAIKRGYSRGMVNKIAKANGWQARFQSNGVFELKKRRF